jgi:putative membrane protein
MAEEVMRLKVKELQSPAERAVYVAGVTTIFTFLGCWAVLAHTGGNTGSRPSANDELFAKKTAQGAIAEVKLGQLAADKGLSEAVKRFARRMVEDHTQSQEVLKEVAQKEGIAVPLEMAARQRATFDELSKLSGAEFDQAYARDMVRDHQDDIADFTSEASGGQKSAMRSFASETLPALREHLKLAREMRLSTLTSSAKPAPTPAKKPASSTNGKRGSK